MDRGPLVDAFGPGEDTVVFTNGVFDLLHPGHVALLQRASACGDALVVGINNEPSAQKLGKGPGRPFCSTHHRAMMVASIACVDAVHVFWEDTPADLIAALEPSIIVKGSEYGREQVVGYDIVEGYGGSVVLADMMPGRSTSALIRRIQEHAP